MYKCVVKVDNSGGKHLQLLTLDLKDILLTPFLHRPVPDMIEDIKSGNGLSFGTGKLRELCKLMPDEGEVR